MAVGEATGDDVVRAGVVLSRSALSPNAPHDAVRQVRKASRTAPCHRRIER
jgi:hypothetical protein